MQISITHIDTACIVLDINGYRIMTDPVLGKAGKLYHFGFGAFSRKTGNPALSKEEIGKIDLILLSHHQHKDNFDRAGKNFSKSVDRVITTKPAAKTLKNGLGLDNWESISVQTPKVPGLKITATPVQHRPWWLPSFFTGKVIGFMLEWDAQHKGAYYISGDTVFFKGIKEIASRFTIDVGLFHLGAVQFKYLTGLGKYTFDVKGAVKAANLLAINTFIPIHYSGWSHFKEVDEQVQQEFDKVSLNSDLRWLQSGFSLGLK
ncbi:MAG: MBL fold metallo-hydrolase [Cyclobacteriaceae bacterium]|nr:MBL fold metallo-hydrolase [Cyclobacteriaceae bacterium]